MSPNLAAREDPAVIERLSGSSYVRVTVSPSELTAARSGTGGTVSRVELFVTGRLTKRGASDPDVSWIEAVAVVASHLAGL